MPAFCRVGDNWQMHFHISAQHNNTLRSRRSCRHFISNLFSMHFIEKCIISLKNSLKLAPKGQINNNPVLVQITVRLATHICVSRLQWAKVGALHKCRTKPEVIIIYYHPHTSCLVISNVQLGPASNLNRPLEGAMGGYLLQCHQLSFILGQLTRPLRIKKVTYIGKYMNRYVFTVWVLQICWIVLIDTFNIQK